MAELPSIYPKCPQCGRPLPAVQLNATVQEVSDPPASVRVFLQPVYPEDWADRVQAEHPDCVRAYV